jgi:hypothetical protein
MALGPGDKQLYATTADGVLVFARAPSGALKLQSCINDLGDGGCAAARMVHNLTYLALSPDGEDLVADVDGTPGGIVMLSRDGAGDLSQRASEICVSTNGQASDNGSVLSGCVSNPQINANGHIVFADANVFHVGVYAASPAGALLTFKRDFPPVCPASQAIATERDTSAAVGFGCTDRNGDAMTFAIVGAPVAGTLGAIDQAAGRVFYNPFGGFTGADSFKFRAFSTVNASADSTVSLNVTAPGAAAPVAPAGLDGDRDGFFTGQDCNDANPAIRPGALEVKGNRVDENCDGLAEPFPTLASGVVHNWDARFTLRVLQITQQFPRGLSAKILCAGKGCRFRSRRLKVPKPKRNAANVLPSLPARLRHFHAGQTVEVWVSAPGFNTKVARIALKRGKQPVIQPLCVVAGETKPRETCS